MLSLQPRSGSITPPLLHPNILPCTISHNGSIAIHERYWNPQLRPDLQSSASQQQHLGEEKPQQQLMQQDKDKDKEGEIWISYFRGRKLLGRKLDLPMGYRGVVLEGEKHKQDKQEGKNGAKAVFDRDRGAVHGENEDMDEDEDEVVEIGSSSSDGDEEEENFDVEGNGMIEGEDGGEGGLEVMNQVARFEQITVWEHDRVPDSREPFARGVQEWLEFAGVVNGGMEE